MGSRPKSTLNRSSTISGRGKRGTELALVASAPVSIGSIPPQPRRKRQVWSVVGAIGLIAASASGVAGLSWLSVQLIVNPQAEVWLNSLVPGWSRNRVAEQPAYSLRDIRDQIRRQGWLAGELMPLGRGISFLDGKTPTTDVLLPVLQVQQNCSMECDRVVQLRVYQAATPRQASEQEKYYLVDQLAITGLEESFAIAPLVEAESANQGSSRLLPLTHLSRFEESAAAGIWLNLSGKRSRGDETIAYGQIFYYHPKRQHLSSKLQWTSPAGDEPIWKEVTGGGSPELIVNHTIGMEPHFEIYQATPHAFVPSPVQLKQISLVEPALNDSPYRSALLLAQNRLWSTSLAWLQAVKQRSSADWSTAAQAQMDVVQWHSQITQNQAEGSWASPSQQILANLIDGRWERATTVFESSVEASQEMLGLLQGDRGRLEKRIKAALQVNPTKVEIKAWGALLRAAQQNPSSAIAWLKQRPQTTATDLNRINALTKRLNPNFGDPSTLNDQPDQSDNRDRPANPTLTPNP